MPLGRQFGLVIFVRQDVFRVPTNLVGRSPNARARRRRVQAHEHDRHRRGATKTRELRPMRGPRNRRTRRRKTAIP